MPGTYRSKDQDRLSVIDCSKTSDEVQICLRMTLSSTGTPRSHSKLHGYAYLLEVAGGDVLRRVVCTERQLFSDTRVQSATIFIYPI